MDLQETLENHVLWLRNNGGSRANLRDANLNRADLRDANLNRADLSGADLSGADLSGASLIGANLNHADLNRADLSDVDLRDANLSGADLSDANLRDANLNRADLRDADLNRADLSDANLRNTCLSANLGKLARRFAKECPATKTGGRVVYRTAVSQHIGNTSYEIGKTYVAPVLSWSVETECHPGIYAASLQWMKENYPYEPLVRCYIRDGDWTITAKGAIRCSRIRILSKYIQE